MTAAAPGQGAAPGQTWWGRAWVEALEQRARLDPNRLPRGQEYARSGSVGELVLAPGEVRARVRGRKRAPYEVRIRVRQFADHEWDQVLDAISAQLGHAAAMLDGELPPEVAADVTAAGLDLLPVAGEVGPRCSCPDDADPCKHSAAVCYLVADALDADPFAVLLLRGRTRGEVLAGLRARRRGAEPRRAVPPDDATTGSAAGGAGQDAGVDARTALGAVPSRRGGPGNWPSASTPTRGCPSARTLTWPAGPARLSAHQPSPRSPAAVASANANWPAEVWHGATAARGGSSSCIANGTPPPKQPGRRN